MNKLVLTLVIPFITLTVSCAGSARPDADCSGAGFYSLPESIIASWGDKRDLSSNRNYVLARAYRDSKEYKKAILYYCNSCFSSHRDFSLRLFPSPVYRFVDGFHFKSELYDDAVYQIALLFQQYREFEYSVRFTRLVSRKHPGLYRDARLLEAQCLVSLGKNSEALGILMDIYDRYPETVIIPIRIASLHIRSGHHDKALDVIRSIAGTGRPSWVMEILRTQMDDIASAKGQTLNGMNSFLLAGICYGAGRYKQSLDALRSTGSTDIPGYTDLLVRVLCRTKAQGDVEKMLRGIKDPAEAQRMTLLAAEEYSSANNWNSALTLYRKVLKSGTEPFAHDALRALCERDLRKNRTGNGSYLKIFAQRYPGDTLSGSALWQEGRSMLRRSPSEAMNLLEHSISLFPKGDDSAACRFWIMKTRLNKGDGAGASQMLADMILYNPDSSYTWRAIESQLPSIKRENLLEEFRESLDRGEVRGVILSHTLLYALDRNRDERDERFSSISRKFPDIRAWANLESRLAKPVFPSSISRRLSALEPYFQTGSIEEINREADLLPSSPEWTESRDIALIHLSMKYGCPSLGTQLTIRLLKSLGMEFNIALAGDITTDCLYPKTFEKDVKSCADRYRLDPSLVYSVIKAESLFNPSVTSPAGAVGLMQLMPATANGIARELSIKNYSLKDPATSILFGSHYLSWLNRYYRGDVDRMVAAYNAGAGNVNKWVRGMQNVDRDEFAEFTPFDETRGYIFRSGKFLIHYRILAGPER